MKALEEKQPELDVPRIRSEFPALQRRWEGRELVYLDSACTALKPRRVSARMDAFYQLLGGCGGKRSTHRLSQAVEEEAQAAREAAAVFLGADSPNEIVFTSGATEAANLVARGFPYEDGRREVVLTDLEHNAVFLPFYEAAQRGDLALKYCRTREGRVDPGEIERLVTERTALVAVTRASNVTGGTQPLSEISRLAHRRGAAVFTDCAQYVATHRESVSAVNVDFAAMSAHKIGGPFGLGVLYGKETWLNRLRPYKTGGGTLKELVWEGEAPEVRYLDAPQRFEAGVPNQGAFPGLSEAIRFLQEIPAEGLRAHVSRLVRRVCSGLGKIPQVRVLGRPDDLAGGALVCLVPAHPEFSVVDFNLFLNHELSGRFIAVRTGEHCAHLLHRSYGLPATVRASFFAYNTPEEADLYVEAVGAYARQACR